jgi:hypothetical protein
MKKRWLLIATVFVAGALALGAIACGDDDDEGNGEEPTATESGGQTAEPTDAETAEPTDSGTPSAEAVEVDLVADAGFDVAGTASLSATDTGGTEVTITITGGLEEGSHQNHIHGGTCASRGDVDETLTALEADASGAAGPTTTTIEEEAEHFQDGSHYFAVHALDGTVVACGDIPAA